MSEPQQSSSESDLVNGEPSHAYVDLGDGAAVRSWNRYFTPHEADAIVTRLREEIAWEQMKFYGRPEPRLTAWYGDYDYRYSGVNRKMRPMPAFVLPLAQLAEQLAFGSRGNRYTGVLLNRYRDEHDRIGLHSDGEEALMPNAPITTLSFGAERRFILRRIGGGTKHEFRLGHGSVLIMEGTTQRHWKHEIPAERQRTGERISLTFRQRAGVGS